METLWSGPRSSVRDRKYHYHSVNLSSEHSVVVSGNFSIFILSVNGIVFRFRQSACTMLRDCWSRLNVKSTMTSTRFWSYWYVLLPHWFDDYKYLLKGMHNHSLPQPPARQKVGNTPLFEHLFFKTSLSVAATQYGWLIIENTSQHIHFCSTPLDDSLVFSIFLCCIDVSHFQYCSKIERISIDLYLCFWLFSRTQKKLKLRSKSVPWTSQPLCSHIMVQLLECPFIVFVSLCFFCSCNGYW